MAMNSSVVLLYRKFFYIHMTFCDHASTYGLSSMLLIELLNGPQSTIAYQGRNVPGHRSNFQNG